MQDHIENPKWEQMSVLTELNGFFSVLTKQHKFCLVSGVETLGYRRNKL